MIDAEDKYAEELEDLLRATRDEDPPPWLKRRIMSHLVDHKPRLFEKLKGGLFQPWTFTLRPTRLVLSALMIALAYWGGMETQRLNYEGLPVQESEIINQNVKSADANYFIGRGLLAGNHVQEAIGYLAKAVELDPDNAEFNHWQGIAYWYLGKKDLERESYARSVRQNPDYLPSLLYLGHNYLETGDYSAAVESYEKVLKKNPYAPEALYNKALAYQKLNETAKEILAFKKYLDIFRTGKWSFRAVKHLHDLGDYSFRSYRIGLHRIVLNMSDLLEPGFSEQKNNEIKYLTKAISQVNDQELHIVVYNRQSKEKSKQVAMNLRNQIADSIGSKNNINIKISWFEEAETISANSSSERELSPSLLLFTRHITTGNRRNSI